MSPLLLTAFLSLLSMPSGVRQVSATSCEVIRINLSLGMTTQLVFDEAPTMTLHAVEEQIKVRSSPSAPRSVALIPSISGGLIMQMFPNNPNPTSAMIARSLDPTFATNFFVYFKNGNQLTFHLRFVEKSKADYTVQVRQKFKKECQL